MMKDIIRNQKIMVLFESIRELTLNQRVNQAYWPKTKGQEMFTYQDKQLLVQRWVLIIDPKEYIWNPKENDNWFQRKQYINDDE